MVSIKEATANAIAFAKGALEPEQTVGLRLEEVESTKVADQDAWLITLSMINTDNPLSAITLPNAKRDYKIFTVLKSTGEVTSMKIRQLAAA